MELISKDYVVELLNRQQLELDGWGDTEAAMELGKARIDVANAKADVTIPDNPTNGDVIKAIFPNVQVIRENHRFMNFLKVSENWWNAPYKAESEDKE